MLSTNRPSNRKRMKPVATWARVIPGLQDVRHLRAVMDKGNNKPLPNSSNGASKDSNPSHHNGVLNKRLNSSNGDDKDHNNRVSGDKCNTSLLHHHNMTVARVIMDTVILTWVDPAMAQTAAPVSEAHGTEIVVVATHGAAKTCRGTVKAAVAALQEYPKVNASIDGTDIVYRNYQNIGMAVGTEKGLVVPVIRNSEKLSIAGIESTIKNYALKARDGKITMVFHHWLSVLCSVKPRLTNK